MRYLLGILIPSALAAACSTGPSTDHPAHEATSWSARAPAGRAAGVERWTLTPGPDRGFTWSALRSDGSPQAVVSARFEGDLFVVEERLPGQRRMSLALDGTRRGELTPGLATALYASSWDLEGHLARRASGHGGIAPRTTEVPDQVGSSAVEDIVPCSTLRRVPGLVGTVASAEGAAAGDPDSIFGTGGASAQGDCLVAFGFPSLSSILQGFRTTLTCVNGVLGAVVGGAAVIVGISGQATSITVTVTTAGTASIVTIPAWATSAALTALGAGIVTLSEGARQQCASDIAAIADAQSSILAWSESDYVAAGIAPSVARDLAAADLCSPADYLARAARVHGKNADCGKKISCKSAGGLKILCHQLCEIQRNAVRCRNARKERDACFLGIAGESESERAEAERHEPIIEGISQKISECQGYLDTLKCAPCSQYGIAF